MGIAENLEASRLVSEAIRCRNLAATADSESVGVALIQRAQELEALARKAPEARAGEKVKRLKCSEFIWIQRDGTPIHVREMDDQHLLNTIRLLRRWSARKAERLNAENYAMVWEASDADAMFWWDADAFLDHHPTWAALQFERRVRGLEELPL